MMEIKNHILKAASQRHTITFDESPNRGGKFEVELFDTIVIHYTAGSSLESSVTWLKNPRAKASAHVVIGKSSEIVQLVPFNVKAWHAGKSKWKDRNGLNHYSIGIEIDNAGLLEKRADGYYTYFGKRIDNSQVVLATHKNNDIEEAWEAFTEKQIETVELLCLTLKEHYPIDEIVGHDDISPGRKIDPGPAFPLNSLKEKVLRGRNDDNQEDTDAPPTEAGVVSADYLNIRSKPDINAFTLSEPLPLGTKLKIMETQNGWLRVKVDLEGWVYGNWVRKV